MAITNKEIMALFRIENDIPEDEPLYTFARWKSMGYQVKKGEKAKYKVALWKYKEKTITKDDTEIKSGYCFGKTTHLFTKDQVEKINK